MTEPTRQVLVVDDDGNVPRLVSALLGDGYQVIAAENVPQALARLEDTPFDVVLTDLAMPDQGGIELMRRAPGWRKLQLAAQLHQSLRMLALAGLRERHPGASAEELRRRLADLLLGPELAKEVYGPLPKDP